MPYSKINHSHSYKKSLDYVLNGEGHDGSERRNLLVFPVGLKDDSVESFYSQFDKLMCRKSNQNNINETRTGIISFSSSELDPDAPESPYIAAQIAIDICRTGFDGYPCVVAIQNDNLGHKLHMHLTWANVHSETGRGFTDDMTDFRHLREVTNQVCPKYITVDDGSKSRERAGAGYRGMLERNEEIKRQNENLPADQQKPLKYIWREDVKERVLKSMKGIKSYKDFSDNLLQNGVRVEFIETKKKGLFFRYILEDISKFNGNIPAINLHARSYRLGPEYDVEAVDNEIEKNNKGLGTPDNLEPESAQLFRHPSQSFVMPSAQDGAEVGSAIASKISSVSEITSNDNADDAKQAKPRRHSSKTRGKVEKSSHQEQMEESTTTHARKLPRREQQEINRMISVLNEDAANIKEEISGDIILFELMPKKRNPRRP